MQWGTYEIAKLSTELITITFPVSFAATAYSVTLGHKGPSNWTNGANVNYVNKTVSDMTVYYCDGYGFSWLAIGMQQWGYCNNSSQISFPMAYKTKCYAITFGVHYNGSQYGYNQVVSYNTLGFTMYQTVGTNGLAIMWIALGVQQWGVGAPYSDGYSVTTLPIPFSNTDYTVIANSSWLNSGAVMASAALSVTQIKVRNGGYTDTYHFLTIGRQQWGTFEKCSVYVVYPIPFSAFASVVAAIDSTDNEACQCRDVQLTKFLPWQKYSNYQGKWMAVGR